MEENSNIPSDNTVDDEEFEFVYEATLGINKGQYYARLPKDLSSLLELKKDSKLQFIVRIIDDSKDIRVEVV